MPACGEGACTQVGGWKRTFLGSSDCGARGRVTCVTPFCHHIGWCDLHFMVKKPRLKVTKTRDRDDSGHSQVWGPCSPGPRGRVLLCPWQPPRPAPGHSGTQRASLLGTHAPAPLAARRSVWALPWREGPVREAGGGRQGRVIGGRAGVRGGRTAARQADEVSARPARGARGVLVCWAASGHLSLQATSFLALAHAGL